MTTEALFWDRIADKYSRQKIGNPTAYEQTLEATGRNILATTMPPPSLRRSF